jgi:hypothetical protein
MSYINYYYDKLVREWTAIDTTVTSVTNEMTTATAAISVEYRGKIYNTYSYQIVAILFVSPFSILLVVLLMLPV